MAIEIFKNESKIKKIGGRLERDYYEFRSRVLFLNDNYLSLFALLGFTLKDKDIIFEALFSKSIENAAFSAYVGSITEKLETGKMRLEKVLTPRMIKKIAEATPEEAEKLRKRETHRRLVYRYKEIYNNFSKKNKPSRPYFSPQSLRICQGALILRPHGIEIDVEKFIEIYESFLQAEGSNARKKHQEAAESINNFFSGAVEITREELERYFIIEHGAVKPNPLSITRENYLRLGYSLSEETKE